MKDFEKVLDYLQKNKTATPGQLNDLVGKGDYAHKHVWWLRKLGHEISSNKDGRSVVSFVYVGPGTSVTNQPAPTPSVAPSAEKKGKIKSLPGVATIKTKSAPKAKRAVAKKAKLAKVKDVVEDAFGSTGASVHSIDPDFDHVDIDDVRRLLSS